MVELGRAAGRAARQARLNIRCCVRPACRRGDAAEVRGRALSAWIGGRKRVAAGRRAVRWLLAVAHRGRLQFNFSAMLFN